MAGGVLTGVVLAGGVAAGVVLAGTLLVGVVPADGADVVGSGYLLPMPGRVATSAVGRRWTTSSSDKIASRPRAGEFPPLRRARCSPPG